MSEQNETVLKENTMANNIFGCLFSIVFNQITLELLIYFFADKVTQYRILHARNNRCKRKILWESCVIMSMFSLILWFHFFPYVFLSMIFCTLIVIFKMQDGGGESRIDDKISNYIYGILDIGKILIVKLRDRINSSKSFENKCEPVSSQKVLNFNHQNSNNLHTQSSTSGPIRRVETHHSNPNLNDVKPRGLINERNLCFFNSVLQALARLNDFTSEIEKSLIDGGQTDPVLDEIVKVFRDLLSQESDEPLSTVGLRRALYADFQSYHSNSGMCLVQASGGSKQEEEDVAEFLTWLLKMLGSSLNRVKRAKNWKTNNPIHIDNENMWRMYNCPAYEEIDSLKQFYMQELNKVLKNQNNEWGSHNARHIANLDWIKQVCYLNEDRAITDMFAGQTFEIKICLRHNKAYVKTDTFMVLHLNMPRDGSTIEDCLDYLTDEEIINDATAGLSCPVCCHALKSRALASSPISNRTLPSIYSHFPDNILSPIRREEFETSSAVNHLPPQFVRLTFVNKLPEYLVIQLMRFDIQSHDGEVQAKMMKLKHKVRCGLHLDMSPYRPSGIHKDSSFYSLHAVIFHQSPSIEKGHYRAAVKTSINTWHLFDDKEVYPLRNIEQFLDQDLIQENVYLLFYCKSHLMN